MHKFLAILIFCSTIGLSVAASATDSIIGDDRDHDGVRDDVAAYITQETKTPQARTAAMRVAASIQKSLLAPHDKEASIAAFTEMSHTIDCLGALMGEAGDDLAMGIEARTMNTEARTKAYLAFDKQLDGAYIKGIEPSEFTAVCGFPRP